MRELTVGSLFTGIGGIDLGLERAGMRVVWQSEIDPYCNNVLAKHWPGIPNLGNIVHINWQDVPTVDVLCGGYPCQPFSNAGKQKGTNDLRHLWPFVAEAISALRPKYAFLENVAAHLGIGFSDVLADMAAIGYDCRWDCLPAYHVGAPHYRDRVFIIGLRREHVRHADGDGRTPHWYEETISKTLPKPVRSDWWSDEPGIHRMAHGIPNQVDRVRVLGNAVVPQIAEHFGRIIMKLENQWMSTSGT